MGEQIVVLQILSGLELGGAESRVMDLCRQMKDTEVQYAFLLHDKGPDFYEEEAKKLGCPVYRVPRFRLYNYAAYKRVLKQFFSEHPEINIVQGHMTSTAAIYLPIAKKCGVQATIAHARSAGVDPGLKGKLTKLLRRNLAKKTDYMWACSTEAAKAVYGEELYQNGKVKVLPNAIDVEKYVPSEHRKETGRKLREKYHLKDRLVIGHVGSFRYAKNHEFLLEVFAEIRKQQENAVLLLV
ncbi:MAG: glycosyltransferase, partial [Lachnospiraceae bacterium]